MRAIAEVFAFRNERRLILGTLFGPTGGPYHMIGLNLHRAGGISVTGIPASGGTTIAWRGSRLQQRIDEFDGDYSQHRVGPLVVTVGRDF